LAWISVDLRRICATRDALTRLCPASADAVRLVLSVVAHAADLDAVARLRSIEVRVTDKPAGRIVVQHQEVAMHAAVLTKTGHVLAGEDARSWAVLSAQTALLVADLHTDGASLLRNAG
jgi:hypothetical protein